MWNIQMRVLQSMTNDEYCNVYGAKCDIVDRKEI